MAGRYKAYPEYKDSGVKWLGDLPTHWVVLGLGKAVDFMCNGSAATQHEQTDDSVAVTRIETISDGIFNFEKVGHVWPKDVMERHRLRAGDIQFSNINSLSMVGKCAIYEDTSVLYAGMNLLHIRPSRRVVFPRYMYRQFEAKLFRNRVEASAKPAINQASIPTGTLRSFDFICPPLPEQKQIAAFLDHETGKIDTLIAKQQALIALLKEKRQAVISHAVTKGLNPDARMKDSGVEWLGDVPEHWAVAKLSYRYEVLLGKMLDDKKITGHHLGAYLRNTDVQWDKINDQDLPSMDFRPDEQARFSVKRGDLLVCEGGEIGRCAIWEKDEPCYYQKALHRLRPLKVKTDATRYMFYLLYNAVHEERFISGAGKSTIAHLPAETFKQYRFAFPPKNEQEEIFSYLDTMNDKFNAIESSALKGINLLQERRTALISAAVTGKIDVRGWTAPDEPVQKGEV